MSENFDLLQAAIDRNTPIGISMPTAAMTQTHRSRLLKITDEGILLESITSQSDRIDHLIQTEEPITVTWRADVRKIEFSSKIIRRDRGYQLNAVTLIEVLLVSVPAKITAVQRRSDYRVNVQPDDGVSFTFWRIAEQADLLDIPASTAILPIDVRDFSAGGCGGIWKRRSDDPTSLAANQRLRLQIDSPAGKILLDARMRFAEKLPGLDNQRVGIQFVLNTASIPDRQAAIQINKLLGELQRMELRRKRLAR